MKSSTLGVQVLLISGLLAAVLFKSPKFQLHISSSSEVKHKFPTYTVLLASHGGEGNYAFTIAVQANKTNKIYFF